MSRSHQVVDVHTSDNAVERGEADSRWVQWHIRGWHGEGGVELAARLISHVHASQSLRLTRHSSGAVL